jgi:hypothetical protein
MPLPTIPGVVRAAFSGLVPGNQPWTNVLHCRYSGGASSPGDADITALDTLLTRLWSGTAFGAGSAWFNNCPGAVTLTKSSYTRLDATSLGLEFVKALTGTGGGSSLPSECAPVLTIRSNQRGRSHRGRIYLPPLNITSIDVSGQINATVRTAIQLQWSGLATALGGPTVAPFWELGVASYLLHVFTPSTLATMDQFVDVQRRRRK